MSKYSRNRCPNSAEYASAELRVKNRQDITIDFWKNSVDKILEFQEKKVLSGSGSISNQLMEDKVRQIYAEFDATRKQTEAIQADEEDMKTLENLEKKLKKRK